MHNVVGPGVEGSHALHSTKLCRRRQYPVTPLTHKLPVYTRKICSRQFRCKWLSRSASGSVKKRPSFPYQKTLIGDVIERNSEPWLMNHSSRATSNFFPDRCGHKVSTQPLERRTPAAALTYVAVSFVVFVYSNGTNLCFRRENEK